MIVYRGLLVIFVAVATYSSAIGVSSAEDGLEWNSRCLEVPEKSFRIVVESKKNASGNWETKLDTQQCQSDAARLDLKHSVLECEGGQVLHIRAVFSDSSKNNVNPGLRFHHRCGTNIAIINKGRTVRKLNADDKINAVSLTNRPLRNNEIFEVKLDSKVNKAGHFMGIGLTSLSPDNDPIPSHLNSLRGNTWMFYHKHIFHNGSVLINDYTRNLDHTQVGETIGVMRSDSGTLHYFHNGVDLGPAASNLPPNLYGGLELYGDMAQMTITS